MIPDSDIAVQEGGARDRCRPLRQAKPSWRPSCTGICNICSVSRSHAKSCPLLPNSHVDILLVVSYLSPKFRRNVGLHDGHSVQLVLSLLLLIQHIVFSEMLDVLGVDEILLLGVLVVVLLEVVDLVLVFVIAVVSRTISQVWQLDSAGRAHGILGEGHGTAVVLVEQLDHAVYRGLSLRLRDVGVGFVEEAVRLHQLVGGPFVAAVVVVDVEEGAGVEGGDVVFLCGAG